MVIDQPEVVVRRAEHDVRAQRSLARLLCLVVLLRADQLEGAFVFFAGTFGVAFAVGDDDVIPAAAPAGTATARRDDERHNNREEDPRAHTHLDLVSVAAAAGAGGE